MPRAAQSPSHQLALGVALVAILAIGAWAVFDDVPSAKEALAAFSAPDTPAPAAWSRTADGWPVAQASPVAATWPAPATAGSAPGPGWSSGAASVGTPPSAWPAAQPSWPSPQPGGQPSAWPTAPPASAPAWPTAQPVAQPPAWPTAQPVAQPPAWPAAQPTAQPSTWPAPAASPSTTARPIVIGAPPPHADRGPCATCHAVVTAAGAPVPAIAPGATAPHAERGSCAMCHRMTATAVGTPVAATAVQAPARPPAPTEAEWQGLEVRPTARGVEVAGAEGAASQAGLAAGDVLVSINGIRVGDLGTFDEVTGAGTLARATVIATRGGQRLAFEVGTQAGAGGAGGGTAPWGAAAIPGQPAGFGGR